MTQRFGNSSWWTEKGEGNKREEHSFLAPTLIPCQSIGRRSLSTLELECLSFTHQTICFIRFIFSPSDPAQPDKALMMKRRGHPCIISELACAKVFVCVVCARACMCTRARLFVTPQQCHFRTSGCSYGDANSPPHSHHLCYLGIWCQPSLLFFLSVPLFSHTPPFSQTSNGMNEVIKSREDSLNTYNKRL